MLMQVHVHIHIQTSVTVEAKHSPYHIGSVQLQYSAPAIGGDSLREKSPISAEYR